MEQLTTLNSNLPAVASVDGKPVNQAVHQYIVVRLGDEQYGIEINYIDNIVRMQNITRVPKVAPYLKGVINLRGEVIPVMSLRLRMNLPADEPGRTTRIIILKLGEEGNVGVMVDEVKQVVNLTDDDIDKISYEGTAGKQNFITGVGKHGEELISLLDLNTITLEES